ncbi:MAG TPA: peptidoglycan DD-metalloendopeptidase family protein [Candidatus Paceibacterota bacterium]|nr:peptidoglycan DD-metalloendopeptidase family protein [Candidatus Paceibacterota bacterium]
MYKKLFKRILVSVFILTILATPLFLVQADTAAEIQAKIAEKNAALAQLEAQLKIYQNELDNLSKQKSSLNVSIKQLDTTKKKLMTDISVTQKKIDKMNLSIENLSSDIQTKEGNISDSLASIKLEIRNTHELEQKGWLETLLSENNFSDIWNDIDNIASIRKRMLENLGILRETKTALEDTRELSIDAKEELLGLKSKLGDQEKIVVQNVNEKSKLLSQTKSTETGYQKLVQTELAKKQAFEKELRDFESQLKFILDPSKLPSAGVLSWPLDRIYVTQEFGAKTGPHRTYASGHSGTDFRARTPLPIYAMADGVVQGTGDTDIACAGVSFGRWVFIEYTNGLSSTYGHLSLIKAAEGQAVKRGELVGYTGGTGRVTAPHLHVSLYASSAVKVSTVPSLACPGKILKQPIAAINAYLDPMFYLPPYVPQP